MGALHPPDCRGTNKLVPRNDKLRLVGRLSGNLILIAIIMIFLFSSPVVHSIDWNDNFYLYFNSWSHGQGEFGFGESDESTVLSEGYVTYYFKTSFLISDPGDYSSLKLYIEYDDAFIIFINGREVHRQNLPGGVVDENTLALNQHLAAGYEEFDISWFLDDCLLEENKMEWDVSIEVHQYQADDSKLSFDAYLVADAITLVNQNSYWNYFDSGGYPDPVESDPLTVIQRPVTGISVIVKSGETFDLLLRAAESDSDWIIWAASESDTYSLSYTNAGYDNDLGIRKLKVSTGDIPYFTYDIIITGGNNLYDRTENCLKVISGYRARYQFMHLTDPHLPEFYFDYISIPDLEVILENMHILNPEFIIITGDLVNRGDQECGFEIFQNILRKLEVPVFITTGNHDVGEWCGKGWARDNWRKYFGLWYNDPESPENQGYYTEDYYFKYGNWLHILMDTYINYGSYQTQYYDGESLINKQRNWLSNLISEYPDLNKMLFYHYDFDNTIDGYFGPKNLKYGFHGHKHSSNTYEYSDHVIYNTGSVVKNRTFRILKTNSNEILDAPLMTGNIINVSFNPSNNGSSDTVSAEISNLSGTYLENLRIDFVMNDKNKFYKTSEGEIIQEVPTHDGKMIVSVEFNLDEGTIKNITVSEDKNIKPILVKIKIYPNPVKIEECTINLDYDFRNKLITTIKIFDITGNLIKQLIADKPGNITWDLKNKAGKRVSSGIYLIEFKTKGKRFSKTQVKKLAIIK
ncbi:metallophosphoesterase [Candidatus Dependentiae bacterium]|nr:metallophosphoesterase [Candidatus Dependentiae bacterium]